MKILFTGASSFTGHWFALQLAKAGHEICTTFTRGSVGDYGDGVRGQRVRRVVERTTPVFACRFGDNQFLELLKREKFDVLCHHAADVTDYKSAQFDVSRAVSENTHCALDVLKSLAANSHAALMLTGTVFEAGEGAGSDSLPSFSPYGLSKKLSSEIFFYYASLIGLPTCKFVIPNPFGPWEDERFTAYLLRRWSQGEVATVSTPEYIRDNIHVSLLALSYVECVDKLQGQKRNVQRNPSGYIESQGTFADRFAREMRVRLGIPCPIEIGNQSDFSEPMIRVNTDRAAFAGLDWNENAAWDQLAEYYLATLPIKR
jgi:UDP-glucose 4-epimerase